MSIYFDKLLFFKLISFALIDLAVETQVKQEIKIIKVKLLLLRKLTKTININNLGSKTKILIIPLKKVPIIESNDASIPMITPIINEPKLAVKEIRIVCLAP